MNYVLTAAQFGSLAAGYGTSDAIAVLRDGQLAKRKILLQALMAKLDDSPAVDLLLSAAREAPESTDEVLRHPYLDAWAPQALRAPDDDAYLTQVAVAAAVRAGLSFKIDALVTHGEVYLPTLGAAAVMGDRATVIGSDEIRIGSVRMGGEGWAAAHIVELERGFSVTIEDQEPYRNVYQWRPTPRLDPATAERFAERLRGAWRIIVARHPEHAEAMRGLLRVVVPLITPESGGSVSAASRQASGSVAVGLPATAEELALLLVHEFMHMKLNALLDLVDLHDLESHGRYLAPWRMDPRPAGPLLQGIYAHTGVTDYWRRRRLEPDAPPVADVEFAYWHRQSQLAAESLAAAGELTLNGGRFLAGLRATLSSWQSERIPGLTRERVEAMVQAQTIRWRLRNWHPADGEVEAVLGAWRSRSAPGPVARAGVLRTDAEGEPSGLPGIVRAIRNALAGAAIPAESDRAYVDGNTRLALSLYLADLDDEDSDDAWVGLAMAAAGEESIVRRRPELVRALIRHLKHGGNEVDTIGVVGWLATNVPPGSQNSTMTDRASAAAG
jgi:HEXXH motif-containing protein